MRTMVAPVLMIVIFGGSVGAGLLGALLGLGGGIVIVPLLTLALHVPLHYAIGASIVSVIATSSGAAAAYLRDRLCNLRVAMLLQVATTAGALAGALLAGKVPGRALYILFGAMLAYSAVAMYRKRHVELPQDVVEHPLAARLGLAGSYFDEALGRLVVYRVARVYAGLAVMFLAGVLSGLLGIGSGLFKVLAMDQFMQLPFKVSSATSNFMIGVTAAASAGVYFARGDIVPAVASPVALGVLAGSLAGARLMVRLRNTGLRRIFVPVLVGVGIQMIARGVGL